MGLGLGEGHARRLGGLGEGVHIFGCPGCGDVYFGETSDGKVAAGVASPCCDEPLMVGELVVGQPYTPRKLCEELREVPRSFAGPSSPEPEPNPSIVPPLGKLAKWLRVLVEYVDAPDEVTRPLDPGLEASESVGGALDDLILFPVGAIVYVAPKSKVRRARVVGYQVKAKGDMAWDVVSPRCCMCMTPTEYGDLVSVVLHHDGQAARIVAPCCEAPSDAVQPGEER